MTDSQVLSAVIDKAIKGGWQHVGFSMALQPGPLQWGRDDWLKFMANDNYCGVIFAHDFAQILWGKDEHYIATGTEGRCGVCYCPTGFNPPCCWQFHLQQLAITPPEERIEYLRRNAL